MHPFSYAVAQDTNSAIKAASTQPNSKFLAGGTTLIDLMKLNVERPNTIIDVGNIPLTSITPIPYGGVHIGAMVTNSDCAHSTLIRENYPVLSEAILAGASAQLRNMATTGGNILQRTRCYYFRDASQPCNKRNPGSGCPAIDGINRIHAVLGTSRHCIAANPSDMCVALAALDATVVISSERAERRVPITEFYFLPGNHPERENVLEPGELITGVDIPALSFARHSHYLKVRDRASYAFALASAAVAMDVQGGVIKDVRIALGGVGTKPWRSKDAETNLIGKVPGRDSFREAAETALKGAKGYSGNSFKIELAKRTVVRALTTIAEMPSIDGLGQDINSQERFA
jgi:xanthine dehydrogenase YagS FAD-binding subunit